MPEPCASLATPVADLQEVDARRRTALRAQESCLGVEPAEARSVDAIQRAETGSDAPGLHLQAHHPDPVERHQVDLACPRLHAPSEDAPAGPSQGACRQALPETPERLRGEVERTRAAPAQEPLEENDALLPEPTSEPASEAVR